MSWHVSEFYFFLRLNNIPWYVITIFCLSIHPLMDIWVVLPFCYYECCYCERGCTNLFLRLCFQFFGGLEYQEVELLNHMVNCIFIFWGNCCYVFHSNCTIFLFFFGQQVTRVVISPHPCQYLLFLCVLNRSILMSISLCFRLAFD